MTPTTDHVNASDPVSATDRVGAPDHAGATTGGTDRGAAVRVQDLVRTYPHPDGGTFDAVAGLSFEVRRGEIFALLGPNGAGKTTTLEIIEGLNQPSAGRAEVLGLDVVGHREAIKHRIGVQLQASSYFELLTLREILVLFGSFYATRRDPEELLAAVGLAEKRNARVGQLSGGQAQRFSIVAALVNDPEVVFLDEPTTGLDPQSRRNLWDLVRRINAEGRTVVLTTHYMEEAEALADRVAIVDHGRLVALDTPAGLIGSLDGGHRIRFAVPHPVDERGLADLPGVAHVARRANGQLRYELTVTDPSTAVPALFAWAAAAAIDLAEVQVAAPTLEDVFLARTGTRLRS
jgi:ABC-2 type transport system ATP-binding protein